MYDPEGLKPEERMAILSLTVELNRIFAKDESEKANIPAINAIMKSFNAAAAALFYKNNKNVYRMCIAGTDFPIALPEARWRACVTAHGGSSGIARFGSWSLPGIDNDLPSWISACLYGLGSDGSFVFLGRTEGSWSDQALSSLASLQEAISPIVETRHERKIEEQKRAEAEKRLARSERRLRDLFEGSRDMIYTAGPDDIITSVNNSAAKLLGYPSKADLTGKPFGDFAFNPDDRRIFLEKMAANGYVDDYEILLTRKDGTPIFCIETGHALKDGSGAITEVQGIVKDISARIANEQKLWKMNLELADANMRLQKTQMLMVQREKLASIGQLAAGIAHEINNPLGFLTSNQKTLEKYFGKLKKYCSIQLSSLPNGAVDGDKASMMADIFSDAEAIFAESGDGFERIVTIVSSLKNFSRVDSSGDFGDFDLNAGIESTLAVAWNEIKYVSELRKNLGDIPHICANGSEINQVILNILVNAAQALAAPPQDGKGLIEISTRLEGDQVVLTIQDNGPGIPPAIQNKIFDPFFTTKEPGKGTGLGLSISYDIVVNKHGGQIWIESEPGSGTSFIISLPVAGPDA
jgi:PAS domain S-box-containing protein